MLFKAAQYWNVMYQLIIKIILSAIVGFIAYFALARIWTHEIDILNLFQKPSNSIPIKTKSTLHPNPIEKEIAIKMISGKISDGVINIPIGTQRFPLITNDASIVFSHTDFNEEIRIRYDSDLFFYLFLKWMNSNFHQCWLLKHEKPLIDRSFWGGPIVEEGIDNSNILTFEKLPQGIKKNNIFFTNPKLFKNGAFEPSADTIFPIEEFAVVFPPNTKICFFNDSKNGRKITFENDYSEIIFRITASSSGPGLPFEMMDFHQKGFNRKEFYKYFTLKYQVSFYANFKNTKNIAEQKKYVKWARTLLNYFTAYFDWNEFKQNK